MIEGRLDTSIAQNMTLKDQTKKYVDLYAEEGLRTLILAKREIDAQYYQQWNQRFLEAQVDIVNKYEKVEQVQSEIESLMELVGSTAIEDKLQDEVGKTISDIKKVGIQLWVLTGDKVETAINIGYSCQLLHNRMTMHIFSGNDD